MNNSIKRNISNIIFEGPEYTNNLSCSAFFDCVLRIIKTPYHSSRPNQSYCIYLDNTNNKHNNFFNPIIRLAEYSRNNVNDVPSVKYLKIPRKYLYTINEIISKIDVSLTKINFVKGGLIIDRKEPENCEDIYDNYQNNYGLKVFRWNYCQTIYHCFGVKQEKPNKLAKALIVFMNFFDENQNDLLEISVEESYNDEKSEYLKRHHNSKK